MGKISLRGLFVRYLRTLHSVDDDSLYIPDAFVHFVIPFGIFIWAIIKSDSAAAVRAYFANAMTAISVISGFMCGLAVMIFELSLDAVIREFGKVAFAYEMQMGKKAYDAFLSKLKCSRVRIMHIKANQPKDEYLNGLESAFYLKKLSLMYRAILLDLLGVPANLYEKRLRHRVETLDNWFAENHRKL